MQQELNRSLIHEQNIKYYQVEHYLTVSSKERNVSLYPSVSHYSLELQKEFKNIYSIELIQGIIPDKPTGTVATEPYLLLKIDEIDDVMSSNDTNIAQSFAILSLCRPITDDGFIHIDKKIHENTVKYYQTPKSSLSRMTVSITKEDGTLFDFGTDSPSPPNKDFQNTFIFKIVTLEKERSVLNQRNIYTQSFFN